MMSVSEEIFSAYGDSYRRMRNTCASARQPARIRPKAHAVAFDDLVAIDQWVITKTFALQNDVVTAYRNMNFTRSIKKFTTSAR